jgi:enterochelin esterase-like enzyme
VIASLYIAAARPELCRDVVALSAALWWPGGSGQLSGSAAIDLALRRPAMEVWLSAAAGDEQKLRDSNDVFYDRLAGAGREVRRADHPGDHTLRAEDVVAGLAHLLRP